MTQVTWQILLPRPNVGWPPTQSQSLSERCQCCRWIWYRLYCHFPYRWHFVFGSQLIPKLKNSRSPLRIYESLWRKSWSFISLGKSQARKPPFILQNVESGLISQVKWRLIYKNLVLLWFRENLSKDLYLMSQMDSDQFVPIWTIASMEGIKVLTTDMDLILDVLRCKCKDLDMV